MKLQAINADGKVIGTVTLDDSGAAVSDGDLPPILSVPLHNGLPGPGFTMIRADQGEEWMEAIAATASRSPFGHFKLTR